MTTAAIPEPREWTALEIELIEALVGMTRQYSLIGEELFDLGPNPITLPEEYAAEALAAFGIIQHPPGSRIFGDWTGIGGDVLPYLAKIAEHQRTERLHFNMPADTSPLIGYPSRPINPYPNLKTHIHKAPIDTGIEDIPGSQMWSDREKMLLLALVKMVDQHLTNINFGGNGELDSIAANAGERALMILEKLGLVSLLPAGRLIGKWSEAGLKLVTR